jgi:hypothetical protein
VSDADLLGGRLRAERAEDPVGQREEGIGRQVRGILNTWDNQLVSWGMAQFAGHAGTLAALLADLKEDARTQARRSTASSGRAGSTSATGRTRGRTRRRPATTWWSARTDKGLLRGDDGWKHIRTQPRLLGAFLLAGNDADAAARADWCSGGA